MVRLKELDILRGFAAINVVLYHYTARFREIYSHHYPAKYDWVFGHYGVELFFVISGFVIFMTLQKVKNVKEFALKRFVRLYPTYWICLLLTLCVTLLWRLPGTEPISFREIFLNFTMIQGVFEVPNIDGAYWSLLPELFFYAFMAFIFWMGWLKNIRIVAVIWLLLMITNQLGILPFGAYFLNLKYGMFFLSGILFYELKYNNGNWIAHLLILISLITAIWVHQTPGCELVFTGIYAIFYLFIYDKLKVLNLSPLLFLGYISYPLYLLHQNIGFAIMNSLKNYIPNEMAVILFSMAILITLAWVVTKFLEKPIIHYLNSLLFQQQKLKAENSIVRPKQELVTINKP